MTAQTQGVTEASAAAKARADAAYSGVAGIERVDGDKSDEMARLHEFVAAIDAKVPRKVAVDDGAMINRRYRLPDGPDEPFTSLPGGWAPVLRQQARDLRAVGQENLATMADALAEQVERAAGAETPPVPPPTQEPGTVLGSGIPGDVGVIPAELIEQAATVPPPSCDEPGCTIRRSHRHKPVDVAPLDYETTGQTTRAGLTEPGDQVAADWLADPILVVEQARDVYVATCQLCPGKTKHAVEASNPGAARASLAGHLRREHNRSPWPGSA